MKVYKFGGASVKDANAVRNLYSLIKDENSELIVCLLYTSDAADD